MLTARPPRLGSPLRSSRGYGGDALRVAELMWQSERTPGRSSSSPAPVATVPTALAAACPTWSDAVTQMSVKGSIQAQLHSLVQPRLDSFAERLGSIVAAAQSEMRELERAFEKSEARVESRLRGLEGRIDLVTDGAARTEQRERDLNTRIAGLAERLLKDSHSAAFEVNHGHRLDNLERNVLARAERVEAAEESCRRGAKSTKKLDDRLAALEENSKVIGNLADELRARINAAANALPAVPDQAARLGALETQVQSLKCTVEGSASAQRCHAVPSAGSSHQPQALALLQSRVDAQRADVEALANQLAETGFELRAQLAEQRHGDQQMALAARLDDINLRVGALKVKADGFEGRLHSGLERVERAERAREWPQEDILLQRIDDRCNTLELDVSSRLNVLESRLEGWDSLEDTCNEIVEQVVEQRLTMFSGELPLKTARARTPEQRRPTPIDQVGAGGGHQRKAKGVHCSGLSATASLGRMLTGHHGARPASGRLGTPAQTLSYDFGDEP